MSIDTPSAWSNLDPSGPTEVVFVRKPRTTPVAVLLGAFDPPTNAHVAVVRAAARAVDSSGVLCMTKTLLARPAEELLPVDDRLAVLDAVADEAGLGFALANRGTYVDVADAFAAAGVEATFVVGSDKLSQLEDPSFYEDGADGVARTFEKVRFVVVPRPTAGDDRPDLRWLDISDVFERPGDEEISATEVRRLIRAGEPIDHLVPPAVGVALRGYTSAT